MRRNISINAGIAEKASFIFLVIPIILFTGWWLSWLPALFVGISLTILSVMYYKRTTRPPSAAKVRCNIPTLVICLLLLFAWTLMSGAGGIGRQTDDWIKHNAIMSDLVENKWPVTYNLDHRERPLVYYVAYYLPAGALGKITSSMQVANYSLLLWTLFGVVLSIYWFARLTGSFSVGMTLLFILFSGMDMLGQVIVRSVDNTIPLLAISSGVEWYTGISNLEYSAHTTSLFWVPQHAITAWIFGCMLLAAIIEKRRDFPVIILWVVSLLWSPMVSLGLLPIVILYLKRYTPNLRTLFSANNLLPIPLATVLLLYFMAADTNQPAGTFLNFSYPDWSWTHKLTVLITFALVDFVILALLLWRHVHTNESREWQLIFIIACVGLSILPFFRYGLYNDLVMRTSMPLLLIMCAVAGRYLIQNQHALVGKLDVKIYAGVIGVLAIGSITALSEFNTHLRGPMHEPDTWKSIGNPNLSPADRVLADQYLGDSSKPFFTIISRNNISSDK